MGLNLFWGFVNNKGLNQPAYLCSLVSTFIIRLLESIISKIFHKQKIVTVAEETGFSLRLAASETLQSGFVMVVMWSTFCCKSFTW